MIPKKADSTNNPSNYRPISLTNCMARLRERVILIKIQYHLKENNIILKQESGFRANPQTKDNLFNLIQKNFEAFNKKIKNCLVFFDISKAFDKVWHYSLLSKLKSHVFEKLIIIWIGEFLKERSYQGKINESISVIFFIEFGVPQGGVLSPILFSIYINDIIFDKTQFKKTKTESTRNVENKNFDV
jgi:retron-type reverse transcriptase